MSKVIGLMSGTSLDGIDAALVDITVEKTELNVDLVEFISISYEDKFRQKILETTDTRKSNGELISDLNLALGEKFSNAVFSLIEKAEITPAEIDFIGSHGQTIYHKVEKNYVSTLQIGSASIIAERTGITTVYNFRMRDVAAGGEGAPLVPYVDHLLYTDNEKNRVLQNIGGIGNYTYLPAKGNPGDVSGSDTGPGNMMIDKAVEILTQGKLKYDKDGKKANKGKVSQDLLDFMMSHPFIKRKAPKSTGRRDFGEIYVKKVINKAKKMSLSDNDIVATITAFTAKSIVDVYRRFIPGKIDEIIISGGGSYNPVIINMIADYAHKILPGGDKIKILTQEDIGYNSEAKEAIAFAVLAFQTMKGKENNIPSATGASKKVVLGEIVPGDNFY